MSSETDFLASFTLTVAGKIFFCAFKGENSKRTKNKYEKNILYLHKTTPNIE